MWFQIEDDAYQEDLGFSLGQLGKSGSGRVRQAQVNEATKARISKSLQVKCIQELLTPLFPLWILSSNWAVLHRRGHYRSRAWPMVESPQSETVPQEPAPVWLSPLYRYYTGPFLFLSSKTVDLAALTNTLFSSAGTGDCEPTSCREKSGWSQSEIFL